MDLGNSLDVTVVGVHTLKRRESSEVCVKHNETAEVQVLSVCQGKRPFVSRVIRKTRWNLGEAECGCSVSLVVWRYRERMNSNSRF